MESRSSTADSVGPPCNKSLATSFAGETPPPTSESSSNQGIVQPTKVTALHDLIAGGVAGSASVIVGHPMDTIKVRLQASAANSSVSASFGGFFSLFRGMVAPLSAAALINAIVFASYGASSRVWDQYLAGSSGRSDRPQQGQKQQRDSWQKAYICGCFTGAAQALVICPMEHLKCRLQVQHGKGAADHLYNGPVEAAASILRSHGLRGLYRGMACTLWREIPAFGWYFAVYDYMKDKTEEFLASHWGQGASHHAWLASAFAGGFSGAFTWVIVYPFDVIKTKIQTTPLDKPMPIWTVGRDIVSQHGWQYMLRGLNVTVLRAFPVNGIIFPVYEFTLMHLTTGVGN